MISVRRNELADANRLLQIWRDAVDATHDFLSADDRVAIDPLVAEYVRESELTVALFDGNPVGFMGVTGRSIDSLFIAPEVHGLGIGRLLVDRVDRPTIVEVNEQNTHAVAFYRRLGFVDVGRSELDGEGRPYPLLHMRRD